MKTIFTFICLIITSALIAQTSFKTGISTPSKYNGIFKVIQINDGSYVGIGIDGISSDTGHILLVKLNAQGSLLSSKTISSSGDDEGISIIKTSDGGFAVSGDLDDEMAILKFDANLNLQWQKQYDTTDESDGARLIQTADGGFIIVGEVYNADGNTAGYLVKTDSQGSVSFSKQYFNFGNSELLDITATNDGNYALLANAGSNNNFSDTTNDSTYIIKIKPDGSVLWTRYINTGTEQQVPFSILQASDGGLVIAGSVYQPVSSFFGDSTQAPQMMMSKFDASGTLLWSKSIVSSDTSESEGFCVAEDNSGNYIFGGLSYVFKIDTSFLNFTYSFHSYLVKLSSGGALQWTKTLDDNSNSFLTLFYGITSTSDGGFVTSGLTYGLSNNDSIVGSIYKFNSNAEICGDVGSFGNITDIGTGVAANITNNSLSTIANDIAVTTTNEGTGVNLCNILPLHLLSFNATLQNKSVNIEWKTANEVNTDYFFVERSSNATAFTALQKVAAKGTNNSNVQTYTTTDLQPLPGTSYYRLQEVDKDGATMYSNIVPVTVLANGTIVISPNPVYNDIRILLQSKTASQLSFQVTDMTGKLLIAQSNKVSEGTNTITIPAASLARGVYVLKVIESNTVQSIKFVKN